MEFPNSFLKASAALRRGQPENNFVIWRHHWHPNGSPGIYAKWISSSWNRGEIGESWGDFELNNKGNWVFKTWNTIFREGNFTNIEHYMWIFEEPKLLRDDEFSLEELETAQLFLQEGNT